MSQGMPDEVTQNFIKQIPLGRLGEVSEIVNAILFLADRRDYRYNRAKMPGCPQAGSLCYRLIH